MEVRTNKLGSPYFQGRMGTPDMAFLCIMTKPLWVTGNTYIMDNSLYVLKGLVGIIDINIYGSLLTKRFRNMKTGI